MSYEEQLDVIEFHDVFGHPVADTPTLIPEGRYELRHDLIGEELQEYLDGCEAGDLVEVADALGDMLYLVYGAAAEHGINLEPIFQEIQRSNMSKLGEDGKPILRYDGKILKGPGYFEPDLAPILREQGAQL